MTSLSIIGRKFVEGYIDGYPDAEGLVPCAAWIAGNFVQITLHESAFKMPIIYGSPFRLSLENVDGYYSPLAIPMERKRGIIQRWAQVLLRLLAISRKR